MSRMFTGFWTRALNIFHIGERTARVRRQKKFKRKSILKAKEIFELNSEETELLANKAGFSFTNNIACFYDYFNTLISNQKIFDTALCQIAGVSDRMFRHFKKDRIPTKESLAAIGIALDLSVDELQTLLRYGGYVLSKSLPNDVVILWYLKNRVNIKRTLLLAEINDTLFELELPLLMTRE